MLKSLKRTLGFIQQHPLAKRHLFIAYTKAMSWQIKAMFIKNPVALKFIDGTKFFAKRGLTGITGNIYTGLHEFEDMAFLLHFLRSEDVFFDVGANVGSYTILAAGVRKSTTISFEPIPETYAMLKKNVELNQLHELVNCENKGVGKEEGQLNFIADEDTTNHIAIIGDVNSISIDVVPLDSFYPQYKPALIKIDVEGFETEVLNGATNILADPTLKSVIIELNGSGERYGFDERKIHKKFLAAGFMPYTYDPFRRKPKKLETYGNFNTIYIRDFEFVNNRLENSPPFMVFNEAI